MAYKKDYKKLEAEVNKLKKDYNFKGLLHFTDFNNLKSILEEGYLYSRKYCNEKNIGFKDGASPGVIYSAGYDVHNSVRFYYRGNTPTLYDNEGVKFKQYCHAVHISMPVFLVFDEELIYLDSTYFSNGNATSSEKGDTASFFCNMDWKNIFHSGPFNYYERDNIINKRQAELLSKEPIDLDKYLNKIVFRCEADKKRAINIIGDDYRYEVDSSLFSDKAIKEARQKNYKNNYIKDYKISYSCNYSKIYSNPKTMIVQIDYMAERDGFETIFEIIDKNGYIDSRYKTDETGSFKITFDEYNSHWYKLNVYINDCLYIEEFLE